MRLNATSNPRALPHLPSAPAVELLIVFLLVGQKLGYWAALAGVSTLITLIPVQASSRWVGLRSGSTLAPLASFCQLSDVPPRCRLAVPSPPHSRPARLKLVSLSLNLAAPRPASRACWCATSAGCAPPLRPRPTSVCGSRARWCPACLPPRCWVGGQGLQGAGGTWCGARGAEISRTWVGSKECWCSCLHWPASRSRSAARAW